MTSTEDELTAIFSELRTKIDTAIAGHLHTAFSDFQVADGFGSAEFVAAVENSLSGGKRFRALSAIAGAAVGRDVNHPAVLDGEGLLFQAASDENLALGSALEMYQAAALTHDDVVDRAVERRGKPATHVELATHHRQSGWIDDAGHFGTASAILIGDFLLASGPYVLELAANADDGSALRSQFERMTGEVAFGQYLELKASNLPLGSDSVSTERIIDVVRLKSARYSIAHPVSLGAQQAGAPRHVVAQLLEIFEAAGIAFQLRDDDLGVFGDAATIGKSATGDVSEKKRTILLALTYANAPAEDRDFLQLVYTSTSKPTEEQVAKVRQIMLDYGRGPHEEFIRQYRCTAVQRLREANFPSAATAICEGLINLVVDRHS